jgi:hypothetical protein
MKEGVHIKVRTTSKPPNCAKKATLWKYGPSSQVCHILVHLEIFSDAFKELVERTQLHPEATGKGAVPPSMPFDIVGPHYQLLVENRRISLLWK